MKRVILLSGKAGSGKDYLADLLGDYGYDRFAFADYLKDITAKKYSLCREDFNTQEGKKKVHYGKTYRQLLIETGAECRSDDDDFFSKKIIDTIKESMADYGVVTDLRFPNEYTYTLNMLPKECVVTFVRINRDDHIVVDDKSETLLDNFAFDVVLDNNGTAEHLIDQIKPFLQ